MTSMKKIKIKMKLKVKIMVRRGKMLMVIQRYYIGY